MAQKDTYSSQYDTDRLQEIVQFLYAMRKSEKNHNVLTEYLTREFARHPENLIPLIDTLKQELFHTSEDKRKKIARRYLHIFSNLCERFGLYNEKLELDDICFRIIEPDSYTHFQKELALYQETSQKIIDEVYEVFSKKLQAHWIKAEIQGRYKNIFSIYKKCQKKNLKHVSSLGDIFGFRIVVDAPPEKCFEILHILHDSFTPIPKRYKDYISIPKINGYQSLHTGLLWVSEHLDIAIEVQIRTKIMDEIATSGIAAHFLYAETKEARMITEKERKLIENMDKMTELISKNRYVVCLTPLWDIVQLSRWSTVTDFAKKIHTDLEKKTHSAIVNGKNQNKTYIIRNFDSIEILTS